MRFSIITPSYRSGDWLKRNLPSVADQGVEHEHIVQDSCSDDGTMDWLGRDARVMAYFEKDQGMYDAVNRGLRRAQGEILAYLNCDEQYLPGALARVGAYLDKHPEVDVCFADAIVVDPSGSYVCHRGAILPTKWHTQISRNLSILTCATFFRRRLIERGHFFPEHFRSAGDAQWVLGLIAAGVKMRVLRCFTSVFAETGSNLATQPRAQAELETFYRSASVWTRTLGPAIVGAYRVRKLLAGDYHRAPFSYEIYTGQSLDKRVKFDVTRPTGFWTRPTFRL
jgi:glycosyltransferase involved in cell wall biosynthesis